VFIIVRVGNQNHICIQSEDDNGKYNSLAHTTNDAHAKFLVRTLNNGIQS